MSSPSKSDLVIAMDKYESQRNQQHHSPAQINDGMSVLVGHAESVQVQKLPTRFGLLSLTGLGLVIGTVWPASGGSIQVAIFNGGPPGVLYEFIAVSIFYFTVAASLAELASSLPSAAGVYLWASVTPGKRLGRAVGFFAGWWNYLAWIFAAASMASIWSNSILQIIALSHSNYNPTQLHVFGVFVVSTWTACFIVCFLSRLMPLLNNIGICWLLGGFIITIVTLLVMPMGKDGHGLASASFVWMEWRSDLGYPSAIVFMTGMLNGAYSIGCPGAVSHLSEEIPVPERNIPLAMGVQALTGFATGFTYLVALMYAINDYDALSASPFPIAEIYLQATRSQAGAICLLIIMQISIGLSMVALYITSGRTLWALSRDGATPAPRFLSSISGRHEMPLRATVTSAAQVTILGCIYLGSSTAFNAFVGCYVLMSSSSFVAAILPHLLTGRRNAPRGPFHLGRAGYVINAIASAYILVWFLIYCLPLSLPVEASSMNYTSVIWVGCTALLGVWWTCNGRHGYQGPLGER